MGEGGVLKVMIVKGKRLAIRDFKSSDPYVVIRVANKGSTKTREHVIVIIAIADQYFTALLLEQPRQPQVTQTAKTKVINSCLNPVWNEEFTFLVKEPLDYLRLEVFDRDRFKSDDKMGNATVNLQPITSASKLKRALQLSAGETKLRKEAPSMDNCLLDDSFVTYIDGEIVQDVRLRLCDVESGELYVTIKWDDGRDTGVVADAKG